MKQVDEFFIEVYIQMSDYPVWWETTLTIYNRYEDPVTNIVMWFRNTVPNCFWKYTGDKITVGETVLETNNIICRIPKDDRYLDKYVWNKLPNDEMGNYFTLGQGDIIIKGEVDDEVNEYQQGQRSTDLLKKYKELQGCMEVQEFAVNVGAGRCNEHYYVKGV